MPRLSRALPPLLRLILGRLLQAAGVALLLASLCFVMLQILPGDLALRVAVARSGLDGVSTEGVARLRAELGLEAPMLLQYLRWLGQLAGGDLGVSLVSGRPVAAELWQSGRYSLRLGLIAWGLGLALALPLGVVAGLRPGGWLDRLSGLLGALIASAPSFLTGIALIFLFSFTLRLLPPAGYRSALHLVLPALTLGLVQAAYALRVVRDAVRASMGRFTVTYSRIRHVPEARIRARQGLRGAAVPIVTLAGLQLAYLLDGFVVVETLFNYPGTGNLLVRALAARDVPVVMGAGLVIGVLYALINLVADLICLWLDPRQWPRRGRREDV